jgi:hypothetical protein
MEIDEEVFVGSWFELGVLKLMEVGESGSFCCWKP